jgi:alpha-methylacyl-CoA racemase
VELTARNPRLVYGRMTGWGREGPLAAAVGHDINYVAPNGTLHAIGPDDRPPTVPLNLVGDFGGGSMLLVTGVLGALWEPDQNDRGAWPGVADRFAAEFATRSRDGWADVFAGIDACVTPVLDFAEATAHPHAAAREAFVDLDGVVQPAPAPRFSRSRPLCPSAPRPPVPVADTLRRWTQDAS